MSNALVEREFWVKQRVRGFNILFVTLGIAIGDFILMALFFGLSYMLSTRVESDLGQVWRITDAIFSVSVLYLVLATGGYREANINNPYSQISRILLNAMMVASLAWLVLRLTDYIDLYQWPWMGPINVVSGGVVAMCLVRLAVHRSLSVGAREGGIIRNVAVVGGGEHGMRLMEAFIRRKEPWTQIVGVYDDRLKRMVPDGRGGTEVKGTVQDLLDYARENRLDDIIVALPWSAEKRLLHILERLREVPVNIRLAPDAIGHHFLDQGFDWVDGVPVYNIYRKPIGGWASLAKRIEDLVLGGMILIAATPVMVAAAIAIKLDSKGPVFFVQPRFGYNNKLIGVLKFRSMYHELRDETCETQTTRGDPRITRVGAFLRRTSIDELPQILNVMRGDMSLVGPRPHAVNTKAAGKLFQEVVQEYSVRHKVKPGITGWAQVNGWRGETDTEEKIRARVQHDLFYIENWSLFLDIEILFRTVSAVFGKHVY